MEQLKRLKEQLIEGVSSQTYKGLGSVDREELGEAIDMIKDIEEILYYCSITKAMEEKEKENEYMKNYSSMNYPMYYNGNSGSRNYDGEDRMFYGGNRDSRNYSSRRNYSDHKGTQDLDKYVQELTDDILDMIHDASPEEKMTLSQKMTSLANKIK